MSSRTGTGFTHPTGQNRVCAPHTRLSPRRARPSAGCTPQLNYPWPLDELGLAVWIYASAPVIAARHFEFGGEACLLEASSAFLPELDAALDEIGDPLWQAIKQLLHNAVACALR